MSASSLLLSDIDTRETPATTTQPSVNIVYACICCVGECMWRTLHYKHRRHAREQELSEFDVGGASTRRNTQSIIIHQQGGGE
jgi:hypothetical protein